MWQRFTERARRVILLGQEEAGKMNSGHVGTEHLLLGLVRENEGVAAQVLQKMGVSLGKVRAEVEAEVQPGPDPTSGEPKLTPKAKRVLELSADEARRMRHNYIGSEHLLLALLREKDGLAATVLRRLGLNLEEARAQVMDYLGPDASRDTAPVTPPRAPLAFDNPLETASPVGENAESSIARHHPRMWSRLDIGARRVVVRSVAEARARRYAQVQSEHLLLGLLGGREDEAAQILGSLGVSRARVLQGIKTLVPMGDAEAGSEPKLAPHLMPILQNAATEATRLGAESIGTRHLLIGLLQSGGTGAHILRRAVIEAHELRAQVIELLESAPVAQDDAPQDADFDPFEDTPPSVSAPGQSAPGATTEIKLSSQSKFVLELAHIEARNAGADEVTPEHLLVALLLGPLCRARDALKQAGLEDVEALRARLQDPPDSGQNPPDQGQNPQPNGAG